MSEFHKRRVEVVAISVDSPSESQKLCQSMGYSFPFLSDPSAQVIRYYGVLHPKGGEDDKDIARPAEFLVDTTGTIRSVNLTDEIRARARPEAVLGAISQVGG